MNASDLRSKSVEELEKDLNGFLEEQFKLRMQNSTGQIVRPHRFKEVRRNIARCNTIIKEKQGE